MKFQIFQLDRTSERKEYGFLGFDEAIKILGLDFYPKLKDYKKVYEGDIGGEDDTISSLLEDIYTIFNTARPEDFTGHSVSIADVIYINDNFFYVDSIGYIKLDKRLFM